jgi:predicted exporter
MTFSGNRLATFLCLVAIVVAGAFVGTKLTGGNAIDTDILSLLPASQRDPPLAAALRRLNEVASSRIVIMLEGGKPGDSEAAAEDLSNSLVKRGLLRPSAVDGADAWAWLFAHRTTLLCPDDRARLQRGEGKAMARDALLRWYSPFAVSNSALLKSDPLLLTPRLMSCSLGQLSGTSTDGNVSIISGSITAPVFDTATQDRLEAAMGVWRSYWLSGVIPDLRLYRAGAIFHADHAAASARLQMSLISAATGALILLIYILMFKSIRPALLAIFLILSCLAIGLAVTFVFFDRIHVMVVVFASALIGMVVDYSTYYFITGIAHPSDSAVERRTSIFRPLTLGMATSVAAFAALLASPIPAFRQIAILGGVGLFAAWALALYLLPVLEGRRRVVTAFAEGAQRSVQRALTWRARPIAGMLLAGAVAVVTGIAISRDNVLDDVRRFQTPAPDLAAEEAHIRAATGFVMPSAFFLVTGGSDQEQKQNEEALLDKIGAAEPQTDIVALAASRLDPSTETAAMQKALLQNALLADNLSPLLDQLGVKGSSPYDLTDSSAADPPPSLVTALRGQTGAVFWSIVPLTVSATAVPTEIRDAPHWKVVDPASGYSELLGSYRWNATLGLIGGTLLTAISLVLVYRRLSALWIMLPTVLAMLAAPSLLALAGISYSFFSAMALFLVVGAGVDYSIFQWERRGASGRWTRLGIALAALMTCTSLGLLGFSSIYPVASFGMTVALGIFLSLVLSPLVSLGFSGTGKRPPWTEL